MNSARSLSEGEKLLEISKKQVAKNVSIPDSIDVPCASGGGEWGPDL